jgi:hypothetical protein
LELNSSIFSIIGLIIDILGVSLVFFNATTAWESLPWMYGEIETANNQERAKRKDKISKIGFYIIILGFVFQLFGCFKL